MNETRFYKTFVMVCGAVPGLLLAWDAYWHAIGADPGNYSVRTTGLIALVFLVLSLLVTPLRKVTGWNQLINTRRMLGLYAFFYALAHLLIFIGPLQAWNLGSVVTEIIKRNYLWVGTLGLLLMAPLAITSTSGMVKRLGAKRWKALHRLAYISASAGVFHYFLLVKSDTKPPIAFGIFLGLLLGYRFVNFLWTRNAAAPVSRKAGAGFPVVPKRNFWSGDLRVISISPVTHNVRTIRMGAVDGGKLPFEHIAGQYLNISLLVDDRRVNRSYTIASAPNPEYCEFTIKREEMGVSSTYMHHKLQAGDKIKISGPAGKFTFTGTEADSVVLISGGVGITPMMSILRSLTNRKWGGDIYFIHSAKTEQDIIFREELNNIAMNFPNVRLAITLSRAEDANWTGQRGRITPDLLRSVVPAIGSRLCYVCGPTSMMEPTELMLRELGVPPERIKTEAFGPAKGSAVTTGGPTESETLPETSGEVMPDGDAAPGVATFQKSGKSCTVLPGQSLLEAAEAIGIEINFDCRSGICGQCKTKLVSGRVTMDVQDALTRADKAGNCILACQAKPVGDVTVEA